MPVKTVKKISTATSMTASATFEPSPMPNQMTNSGASTTRGTAFKPIITGSSSSPMKGVNAAAAPSTAPSPSPMTSPPSAAENVA